MKGFVIAAAFALASVGLRAPSARAAGFSCSINSVTGVSFGNYNPFSGTDTTGQGSVVYECFLFGIFDHVEILLGTGYSNSYAARTMLLSGHALQYNLYRDASFVDVFGDGNNGTKKYTPTSLTLGPVTVPIYGKVPKLQNAWAGNNYQDVVIITMNF